MNRPAWTRHVLQLGGAPLVLRHFAAATEPRGAVLIVPAMGVAQDYYVACAEWLTREGYAVLSFDYRGMGESRQAPLRSLRLDLLDWARDDCGAALRLLGELAPGLPRYWLGHSLGGQILPFVPGHEALAGVVTVASGSGYWRENAAPLRRKVWLMWYLAVPLGLMLTGYFPGRRLGMVGDLPPGVARQWRRWCLHPDYAAGAEGELARSRYAAVRVPIVSLSFSDDEFLSERNTRALHDSYSGAPLHYSRLAPADIGVTRIGHFGFFQPRFEHSLWRGHLLPALRSQGAEILPFPVRSNGSGGAP